VYRRRKNKIIDHIGKKKYIRGNIKIVGIRIKPKIV
jgi:hypothetical protein